MIRFPNPGSDMPTFIRIFQTLYTYLNESKVFTLDDISRTLTAMNLAASSGFVGKQALQLSTRDNRSRDPLYNQSKMYTELYRSLGWMCSNEKKALLFSFTLLGEHVATVKVDPRSIFEESILGINYPNQIIDNKNTDASRTFACILRAAYALDGVICRDEIILGAMNVDDTDKEAFNNIIAYIKRFRGNFNILRSEIESLSQNTKIQINTLRNYTRFPISALVYCEWFEKERTSALYPNSRNMVTLKMTPYGYEKVEWLNSVLDVRISFYEQLEMRLRPAMIRLGFYTMLQRANFDIAPIIAEIASDKKAIANYAAADTGDILFSPYQTIKSKTANAALGIDDENSKALKIAEESSIYLFDKGKTEKKSSQNNKVRLLKTKNKSIISESDSIAIAQEILWYISKDKSDSEIVELIFNKFRRATKEVFYPLIVDLFNLLGFNCFTSRSGINYERWDAIAVDEKNSIPIEIKSPTEEEYISIKSIRQAIENKIILLSRKSYVTDWKTTSLVVGYNMPNDRAEVSRLIEDIRYTFNVKIGVIDFRSLLEMVVKKLCGKTDVNISEIIQMEGLINIENS